MKNNQTILIVDDNRDDSLILETILSNNGFKTITATEGVNALRLMQERHPALVLLDVEMPVMDGLEVLREVKRLGIGTPVIIITASGGMDTTVKAIRLGAYDYLTKPVDENRLMVLTRRCLEDLKVKAELERDLPHSPYSIGKYAIIGSCPAMVEVYKAIGSIAGTDNTTNVLILGESGTGKELVARQIHLWCERADEPFIALNITAMPDTLLESELFGFEKGAFTGAGNRQTGKFEQAGRGTIFLDEIGSMSRDLQHKLLRVLQEREFYRIGGREIIPVNCRIIAATNEDLKAKMLAGEFRKDLYYRLNVVSVQLPPLRKRREDIPRLIDHFVFKKASSLGRQLPIVPLQTIRFLTDYDWHGNVRELENAITGVLAIGSRERLLPEDFTELAVSPLPKPRTEVAAADNSSDDLLSTGEYNIPILDDNLEKARIMLNELFEKKFITNGLQQTHGSISKAAEMAGISRQRYYQLLKKYGILSNRLSIDN